MKIDHIVQWRWCNSIKTEWQTARFLSLSHSLEVIKTGSIWVANIDNSSTKDIPVVHHFETLVTELNCWRCVLFQSSLPFWFIFVDYKNSLKNVELSFKWDFPTTSNFIAVYFWRWDNNRWQFEQSAFRLVTICTLANSKNRRSITTRHLNQLFFRLHLQCLWCSHCVQLNSIAHKHFPCSFQMSNNIYLHHDFTQNQFDFVCHRN